MAGSERSSPVEIIDDIPLRVLLIEDSEDDAALLLLESDAVAIRLLTSGVIPAALHTALDNQKWDLVIFDHSMPHFSGGRPCNSCGKESEVPFILFQEGWVRKPAVAALKTGHRTTHEGNLKRLVPAVQRELREAQSAETQALVRQVTTAARVNEAIGGLPGGIRLMTS